MSRSAVTSLLGALAMALMSAACSSSPESSASPTAAGGANPTGWVDAQVPSASGSRDPLISNSSTVEPAISSQPTNPR